MRSRSGIVLLTGPCNAGKSTATYSALALLRDEGRKIITVEWPIERMLPGIRQYWVRDGGIGGISITGSTNACAGPSSRDPMC